MWLKGKCVKIFCVKSKCVKIKSKMCKCVKNDGVKKVPIEVLFRTYKIVFLTLNYLHIYTYLKAKCVKILHIPFKHRKFLHIFLLNEFSSF